MASVTDIRVALARSLEALPGLRRSSAVMPSDQTATPFAYVSPGSTDYDLTFMRGTDRYTFNVVIVAGSREAESVQRTLDGYLESSGSSSVKAAIESDPTLGGAVSSCRVVRAEPASQFLDGSQQLAQLVQLFVVDVVATGS